MSTSKDLEATVLELYLSGLINPRQIAMRLAGRAEGALYDDLREAVGQIIGNPAFQREVNDARADYTGSVVLRFKRNVHKFAGVVEDCAEQADDLRTRLAAAKEGLHIAGVSGVTKHEIHSPSEYAKLVEKYVKKPVEIVKETDENGHQTESTGPSSITHTE